VKLVAQWHDARPREKAARFRLLADTKEYAIERQELDRLTHERWIEVDAWPRNAGETKTLLADCLLQLTDVNGTATAALYATEAS
jgi:hypothetical protein